MDKGIKKEIERNLRNPSGEYVKIIADYKKEVVGTEKEVIIKFFYERHYKYYSTMRELNRHGHYLEQTTFYRLKDDIIIDIALRASYKGLICPYSNKTKP